MKHLQTKDKMNYPLLQSLEKPILTTKEAAFYLNRKPQTLRHWSHKKTGDILPLVINGRLGWRVDDIKKLFGIN